MTSSRPARAHWFSVWMSAEHLLEREPSRVDEIRRQRPVHEGVVWVGAVANANVHGATTVAPSQPRLGGEPIGSTSVAAVE